MLKFDPQVYVQGSFRLGTAIKPFNDSEDYDVDSVCEFRSVNKAAMTQRQLKDKLGVEIKSYAVAKNMTKPVTPGRRCWKLEYADGCEPAPKVDPCASRGQRIDYLTQSETLLGSGSAPMMTPRYCEFASNFMHMLPIVPGSIFGAESHPRSLLRRSSS